MSKLEALDKSCVLAWSMPVALRCWNKATKRSDKSPLTRTDRNHRSKCSALILGLLPQPRRAASSQPPPETDGCKRLVVVVKSCV